MKIRPARRMRGRLRVPGDKSISHRAALKFFDQRRLRFDA
jgi:5-enolpyruvylshikimate-3-phosphate synthase